MPVAMPWVAGLHWLVVARALAVVAEPAEVAVAALPVMLIPAVPALMLAAVRLVNPDPLPKCAPVNELLALFKVRALP